MKRSPKIKNFNVAAEGGGVEPLLVFPERWLSGLESVAVALRLSHGVRAGTRTRIGIGCTGGYNLACCAVALENGANKCSYSVDLAGDNNNNNKKEEQL